MKTLFIASVDVMARPAIGMSRHESTRIIPVWADAREDVDRMVREAIEGEDQRGATVSVTAMRVEAAIGTPN